MIISGNIKVSSNSHNLSGRKKLWLESRFLRFLLGYSIIYLRASWVYRGLCAGTRYPGPILHRRNGMIALRAPYFRIVFVDGLASRSPS